MDLWYLAPIYFGLGEVLFYGNTLAEGPSDNTNAQLTATHARYIPTNLDSLHIHHFG